jgi:hypothetical protein
MKGCPPNDFGGWPARISILTVALALALAGCSNGLTADGALMPGTKVDRYTVGDPLECPTNGATLCDDYLRLATDTAIGKRGVAPTAIVGHRFYNEGIPTPPGATLSGPPVTIVVFDLADGSRVAVGVHCGVGPCQVIDR